MLETMMVGMIEPGPVGMSDTPRASIGRFIIVTDTCLEGSSRSEMSCWSKMDITD